MLSQSVKNTMIKFEFSIGLAHSSFARSNGVNLLNSRGNIGVNRT